MGKGRDPKAGDASDHVSRPMATLKDPSSFGPPPRNVNYHGGAALPNEITPDRGGWGAPLTQEQIAGANRAVHGPTQEEIEQETRPAGPPLPYRADRTGLQTNHLPPPPTTQRYKYEPRSSYGGTTTTTKTQAWPPPSITVEAKYYQQCATAGRFTTTHL